jgi:AcrR family transcriptional regulator
MTAEERRQSIIDATIRVVSRLNYDRATTALIAKEARVNEALIYNHFRSKQQLQIATLDYLIEYRLQLYRSHPVFHDKNKNQSIIKAMNAQYLKSVENPAVDMFACILKAMFAIDKKIREKAWECTKAFYDFNMETLIEDRKRGFVDKGIDLSITAWEMLSTVILLSSLAVNGKLDEFGIEKFKKSQKDFHRRIHAK